jgi:hypothetical protein
MGCLQQPAAKCSYCYEYQDDEAQYAPGTVPLLRLNRLLKP